MASKHKALSILAVSNLIVLNNFKRKNGTSELKFAFFIEIAKLVFALDDVSDVGGILHLHEDTPKSTA